MEHAFTKHPPSNCWLPRSMRRNKRIGKPSQAETRQSRNAKRYRWFKRWEQLVLKSAHGHKHKQWGRIGHQARVANKMV